MESYSIRLWLQLRQTCSSIFSHAGPRQRTFFNSARYRTFLKAAQCGAHLRGGRQAEGLTAAATGEAAWFGGAKRVAEPGCERSERRIRADAQSVSARTDKLQRRGLTHHRPPPVPPRRKPPLASRPLQAMVGQRFIVRFSHRAIAAIAGHYYVLGDLGSFQVDECASAQGCKLFLAFPGKYQGFRPLLRTPIPA